MSRFRLYQVDAFTSRLFGGNPAAVVPLVSWLDDDLMQSISAENNLSETAFFVPSERSYGLRWFTPEVEVKLCGHATLATAHVLFTELESDRSEVRFDTRSGELVASRDGDAIVLDFPCWQLERLGKAPDGLARALGVTPLEVLATAEGDNFFAVLESEEQVRALAPDMRGLTGLHPAGVAVTARSRRADCVVRYFAPSYGVPEDPATGSIQCGLVPYWSAQLGKPSIHSLQVSRRGAEFFSELCAERTLISGRAVKYLEGWIHL